MSSLILKKHNISKIDLQSLPQSEKKRRSLINLPLFELIRYTNSNYAGNPKNKTLVMGYYFFICRVLVS